MTFNSQAFRSQLSRNAGFSYVLFTLFIALLLNIFPAAAGKFFWRPDFVAVILLYWCLHHPRMPMMGIAWALGLVMDVVEGGLLGQHALSYTVMAYVALFFHRRILFFPAWQQALYILVLLFGMQSLFSVLKLFVHGVFPGWGYFLSSLIGALIWPLLAPLLQSTRRLKLSRDKFPAGSR